MRSKFAPIALLGTVALASIGPHPAYAQGVDDLGTYGAPASTKSPQEYALELRFGRYDIKLNEEFAGKRGLRNRLRDELGSEAGQVFSEEDLQDFENTFFGSTPRYHVGMEYDWQLFRLKNTLSLGPALGLSVTQFDAKAYTREGDESQQGSSLTIVPVYLAGVLRIDALADRTPIPLVPYAKLGLGTALWWFDDGVGLPRTESGKPGKGSSSGWLWAAGVMLRLDILDPGSAADLDSTYGINHSYAFFEWSDSYLDNFGGDALHVGSSSWTTGIALEF